MSLYFIGIAAALLGAIAHGWTNIVDNYFSDKIFKRLANLIFFSAFVNLIFLPVVLVTDFPKSIPVHLWGALIIISLIEVFYSYPYYWSLQRMDTSIIVSLFSIGKIFSPLLAFFIVGEHLGIIQYIGFFLIIISSVCLTFDPNKFRLNKAFLLMLIVSILLVIQAVLYKYIFDAGVSWGSAMTWTTVLAFFISGLFVFLPKNLRDFKESSLKAKKIGWLFFFNQFLSWGGEAANTLALALIPVSIVKGITSIQSIFVFMFAFLFARKLPFLFKENLKENTGKKIFLLILIAIGTILITLKT
ncbi:MAG: Conserved hypothetical rane protein family [Candidatus Taylorbacteria bacterium]|nr:Conserved hypothetical rane protein family [Candidatus Taylorbacteria bacterium]